MAELRGVAADHVAAQRVAADFPERAGDAAGIAGELHGGGVGEEFALARHGGLDEPAEEIADVADDHQREPDRDDDDHAAVLLAAAGAPAAEGLEGAAADEADEEDAENDGGDAHVQLHVAVEDVAELVADDALQLVARELVERAASDGHDGVAGGEAGGEGVQAGLVLEHVDGGHRDAGGDGHFLDDVEQLTLAEVGGLRVDRPAAGHLGDGGAAGAHLRPFIEGGETDDGDGAASHPEEKLRIEDRPAGRGCPVNAPAATVPGVALVGSQAVEGIPSGCIPGQHRAQHSEHEEKDEPVGSFPGALLGLEEIHAPDGLAKRPVRLRPR